MNVPDARFSYAGFTPAVPLDRARYCVSRTGSSGWDQAGFGGVQRQPQCDGRTAERAPRGGDVASVRLGDRADDRQAEAKVVRPVPQRISP